LKKYPNDRVAYELKNEPGEGDPEKWNVIVNRCVSAIRELEPERTLIIGSNRSQGYNTVKNLRTPENDPNIIIAFHYYEPFLLTHYQGSWTILKDITAQVHYPGPLIADVDAANPSLAPFIAAGYKNETWNIDVIESLFKQVLDEAGKRGLKVYCSEYGCINSAPEADKIRWYKDMTTLFNRYGIPRANWDYKGDFAIVFKGRPQTALIQAILGKE
jgi:endoglucanase